jgi:hypothetical protein
MAILLAPAHLLAQAAPLPRTRPPTPTAPAITAADLMTRLYIFADDSMQGRETGTIGHVKSTAYLAQELERLGLEPAGDHGSYFQAVPLIRRALDVASVITVSGAVLRGGTDFIADARGLVPRLDGTQVIFGGTALDTADMLTAEQVRGRIVVLRPEPSGAGPGAVFGRRGRFRAYFAALRGAAAFATIADAIDPAVLQYLTHPSAGDLLLDPAHDSDVGPVPQLTITPRAAAVLLGGSPDTARPGQLGTSVTATLTFNDEPAPARNVAAILRGSDPARAHQYVAIGAHSDHLGFAQRTTDHDSLHLYAQARFGVVGMVPPGERPTPEQQARVAAIRLNLDSLRAQHPVRRDSIWNGADDDGSGSVAMLEVAEALALGSERPGRSVLFVWHTGEEKGLQGSRWFTRHPTVPRDSIVAQINLDMVGRGAATDLPVGGSDYVAVIGARRLSTELSDLVEQVNATQAQPLQFDYRFDAADHPERLYCRSDHFEYARWGIPIVYFTTGLHGDYHRVTDEPQYIDYPRLARITGLVHDVALRVANLDHRLVADRPRVDPRAPCRQ